MCGGACNEFLQQDGERVNSEWGWGSFPPQGMAGGAARGAGALSSLQGICGCGWSLADHEYKDPHADQLPADLQFLMAGLLRVKAPLSLSTLLVCTVVCLLSSSTVSSAPATGGKGQLLLQTQPHTLRRRDSEGNASLCIDPGMSCLHQQEITKCMGHLTFHLY